MSLTLQSQSRLLRSGRLQRDSPRNFQRCAAQVANNLAQELQTLDAKLEKEDSAEESSAVAMMEDMKSAGLIKAFGAGRQVPKRAYSLEELRLNKIETTGLLSPEDKTLNRVRTIMQAAGLAFFGVSSVALHLDGGQIFALVTSVFFVLATDQIANGGGFEALLIDVAGRVINKDYAERVASHEAGHFLVAYLIGLLPKKYILSSVDAFKRYGALNVQAGTQFCDENFQKEMASGKMTSSSLDQYCCIALSGVAVEYLLYGQAEGGLNDVQQLDGLLKALQFSQAKANSQVRWAVLNVVELLRRHRATHAKLAAAMASGKSIGQCIDVIEQAEVASANT